MAAKSDLIIDQGTTYSTTFNLTDENGEPLNLNGYSAVSQIRKYYTSVTAISFTCSIAGSNGEITVSLSANQTANIVAGRYLYDIEITSPELIVSRVVEGIATITPQVTR